MNYTKSDIKQMRAIIRAISQSDPKSTRRANAIRRAGVLDRRLTKKDQRDGKE